MKRAFLEPLERRTLLTAAMTGLAEEAFASGDGADLTTTVTSAPQGQVIMGQQGQAQVRIRNAGTARLTGVVPVNFYLSTDPLLDDADVPLTAVEKKLKLSPGTGKAVKVKFDYPVIAGGDYFLLAETDPGNVVVEADETNNVGASATPMTLVPAAPDLSSALANASDDANFRPIAAGDKAKLLLTMINSGNVQLNGKINSAIRLATDTVGSNATELALVRKKVRLAPGDVKQFKLKVRIPAETAAGAYRLLATVDTGAELPDIAVGNNLGIDPLTYLVE